MFNDNIIRTPINKTAAVVTGQKGCHDELTPQQERESITGRLRQIDSEIVLHPKKSKERVALGLEKFRLQVVTNELNKKIKDVNIELSTRQDFTDCVFSAMKESLTTFKLNEVMSLASRLYEQELIKQELDNRTK